MVMFYGACGAFLVCLGLAGVVFQEGYLKKILSLNLFSSGVFLLLITLGGGDAVANALVLTGIVVMLGATALALALVRAHHAKEHE